MIVSNADNKSDGGLKMTRIYQLRLRQKIRKAILALFFFILLLNYLSITILVPKYITFSPLGLLLIIKNAEMYYRDGQLAIILEQKPTNAVELSKFAELSWQNIAKRPILKGLVFLAIVYFIFDILEHLWQFSSFIWQHKDYDIGRLLH